MVGFLWIQSIPSSRGCWSSRLLQRHLGAELVNPSQDPCSNVPLQPEIFSEFHADKPDRDKDKEDSNEDSDKEEEMDEDVE